MFTNKVSPDLNVLLLVWDIPKIMKLSISLLVLLLACVEWIKYHYQRKVLDAQIPPQFYP